MNKKELWTTEEKASLDSINMQLAVSGMTDIQKQLGENIAALEYQAIALSLYPSILSSNRFGGRERNLESLVTVLSERYREEDVFVMPTKAILSRSYEIGKINLFYMLKHICTLPGMENSTVETNLLSFIMNRMLSIMTEDVLLNLLSDPVWKDAKPISAAALAQIWEGRISTDSISFNPELRRMWLLRRESLPVFGTLLGTYEYLIFAKKADDLCLKYIWHSSEMPDEANALEEFLFGLDYEELYTVREALSHSGKASFNRDEIAKILGRKALFFVDSPEDPLELYRFYNHRRKQASSRRWSRMLGPIKTFEENFMAYLLLGKDKPLPSVKQMETSK
jgi:hypothetical protein